MILSGIPHKTTLTSLNNKFIETLPLAVAQQVAAAASMGSLTVPKWSLNKQLASIHVQ